MLTNKDIRVEKGNLVLNGDKFPLDGQSPEAIMEIVEDNSDTTPTENSTAPITSGGVYTALAGKEDTLTFDTAPTASSSNPVTSGGIKTAIESQVSLYTMADQSISVTGPYTDIQLTKPVASGYTFYLVAAFAYNTRGWNLSNINSDAGSIRVYSTENTEVTSNIKTQWLKVKNS